MMLPVSGIGGKIMYSCSKVVCFNIHPHFDSDFVLEVEAHVIPKISGYVPTTSLEIDKLDHLKDLVLADPKFTKKGQIEILLGTTVQAAIVDQVCRASPSDPIATSTKLGWIVSGNAGGGFNCNVVDSFESNDTLFFDLEKFWRQEEIFDKATNLLTSDEQACEDFFVKTHYRDESGRYVVRLPFKDSADGLTFKGSFTISKKLLDRIEARFVKDIEFHKAYHKFFFDYKDLGHMEESHIADSIESYRIFLFHTTGFYIMVNSDQFSMAQLEITIKSLLMISCTVVLTYYQI